MLSVLAKLLKALNSDASPSQISLAVSLALIIALTPFFSWHNAIVLLIALVVRVNLSAFLLALAGWSVLAWFVRSEEHTSELQSRPHLVCRLLLEKKKMKKMQ